MTERTPDSILIRLQDHDDETMEVLVNGRCVAWLNHDEHGSKTIRKVIRVLELTAGELGVGFSDET